MEDNVKHISANPRLTPSSVSELFDSAFFIYRNNFVKMLLPVILITLPLLLVQLALESSWLKPIEQRVFTGKLDDNILEFFVVALGRFLIGAPSIAVPGAISLCFMGVISAPICLLTSDLILARASSTKQHLKIILSRSTSLFFIASLALYSLLAIFVFFLMFFGVIGSIFAAITATVLPEVLLSIVFLLILTLPFFMVAGCAGKWFVTTPSLIVLEGSGALAAITRCASLAKGKLHRSAWGVAIGIPVIVYGLQMLFALGLLSLYSLFAYSGYIDFLVQTAIVTLAGVIFIPYGAILSTLLYFDQRVRNEGVDIDIDFAVVDQKPAASLGSAS